MHSHTGECNGAGCRLCWLYDNDESYRRHWDSASGRQAAPPPAQVPRPAKPKMSIADLAAARH